MGPLHWLADRGLDAMIFAFNWASSHMTLSGALYTTLTAGYVMARIIRAVYPNPVRRPRWASALHLVCAPVDEAVTGLLKRFGRGGSAGPPGPPAPSAWRPVGARGERKAGIHPRKGVRGS